MKSFLLVCVGVVTGSCAAKPPTLMAGAEAASGGVVVSWAATEAETVVVIDGEEASVEQTRGARLVVTDRTKEVRVAAMGPGGTTWWRTHVEAPAQWRDAGVGLLLRDDGQPASGAEILVNGVSVMTSDGGSFSTPEGVEPYSIQFSYRMGLDETVTYFGVRTRTPEVRSVIGRWGYWVPLEVRAEGPTTNVKDAVMTILTVQHRREQSGGYFAGTTGRDLVHFSWNGAAVDSAEITAVTLQMRKMLTDNTHDLPLILGASRPRAVSIQDQTRTAIDLTVEPLAPATRDLYLPTELGNHEALIDYGPPGNNMGVYSGRVAAHAVIPVIDAEGYRGRWVVGAPIAADDIAAGAKESEWGGSGDFVVPEEGPVVAPLYAAPVIHQASLSGGRATMVLDWDIATRCLCRAEFHGTGAVRQRLVAYSVGPIAFRDLAKVLDTGTYQLTLVCYPEIATVDEVLTPGRAMRFFEGSGRLARVQSMAEVRLTW